MSRRQINITVEDAEYDPRVHPPFSETPEYPWASDPAMLAQEIGASVVRRLSPRWTQYLQHPNSGKGTFGSDLRDALDREIAAALKRVLPAARAALDD